MDNSRLIQQTQQKPRSRIRIVADFNKEQSEALDREIARSSALVRKLKADNDQLAETDQHAWMKTLLLRHSVQLGMGIPSDFIARLNRAIDNGKWEFLAEATKAFKEISQTDKRQHLIVRTLLEAFKDLRRIRNEQFLGETSAKGQAELQRLKEQDPQGYRCAIEELRIRNLPNSRTQKIALPTKAEVRREAVKRIKEKNPDWEIPETEDWTRYLKLAALENLPKSKAGRRRKNLPNRSGKGRKLPAKKV
jgi:hypothetical protein